jgi:adenine-specific DNA-methyltransferase
MSRSILGLANKQQRPNLHYNLVDATTGFSYPCAENTGWRYSQETMGEKLAEGCIIFPKKRTGRPREKVFLKKLQTETTGLPSIIDGVYTAHGTAEIRAIFGRQVFDFPKPSDLISELIRQASENDSIILDSFAGSGTTAHAVLNLNKRDGGNRKFILIEMMEYAETITAERVKRVINGYGEGSKAVAGTDGDFSYYSLGERVFDDQGNLNEALSVDEIREYVAWSERLPGAESSDNPYWLGAKDQTGYYFFYEPTRATVLNLDFLATLTRQTESYLIYADTCLLDEEFMRRHTIRFKKIPRDISRF